MNLIQFKQHQLRRHHASGGGIKVIFDLDGLTYEGATVVAAEGAAYTCTLVPEAGKYLPQVISVTGTTSAYAFKYDYTTGVIYIPSGEIYGDITITAAAVDYETNVPAVLEVAAVTASPYDGTTTYENETFFVLNIYPCRGSTVSVTFDGVTKNVTGDVATSKYDSTAKKIWFGTYLGESDGTTATSGKLEISGAYESYGIGSYLTYSSSKSTSKDCECVKAIDTAGIPIYIADSAFGKSYILASDTLEFNISGLPDSVTSIKRAAFGHCTSVLLDELPENLVEIGDYAFARCAHADKVEIPASVTKIGDNPFEVLSSGSVIEVNFLEIASGNTCFRIDGNCLIDHKLNLLISGFENSVIPDGITTIGANAFYNHRSDETLTVPASVTEIKQNAFLSNSGINLNMLSTTPPKIGSNIIGSGSTVTVPAGYGDTYKAAEGWSTYAAYIVEAGA